MMRNGVLAILLVLMLQGCGFQLRGSYDLPAAFQQVAVTAPKFSEFADVLKLQLEQAGAQHAGAQPSLTIDIVSDRLDRRTLSLSSSGQVAEYELIYTVQYQLELNGQLGEVNQIEVFRDYQDDPNFALAKTRERELLVAEMRMEAARMLLQRVIQQVSQTATDA
ncbi:LPS assembly lipoprotein LptE [Pseudidiomarina taiwanensis]|nr:LPS assembly lipoprotein LptE [Pseudidiomarina taiwanensis]